MTDGTDSTELPADTVAELLRLQQLAGQNRANYRTPAQHNYGAFIVELVLAGWPPPTLSAALHVSRRTIDLLVGRGPYNPTEPLAEVPNGPRGPEVIAAADRRRLALALSRYIAETDWGPDEDDERGHFARLHDRFDS